MLCDMKSRMFIQVDNLTIRFLLGSCQPYSKIYDVSPGSGKKETSSLFRSASTEYGS